MNSKENVNGRIDLIIKDKNMSVRAFADQIGISQSALFNIVSEKGRLGKPGYEVLLSIITSFEINPIWLMTGEGEMYQTSSGTAESQNDLIFSKYSNKISTKSVDSSQETKEAADEMATMNPQQYINYLKARLREKSVEVNSLRNQVQILENQLNHMEAPEPIDEALLEEKKVKSEK